MPGLIVANKKEDAPTPTAPAPATRSDFMPAPRVLTAGAKDFVRAPRVMAAEKSMETEKPEHAEEAPQGEKNALKKGRNKIQKG